MTYLLYPTAVCKAIIISMSMQHVCRAKERYREQPCVTAEAKLSPVFPSRLVVLP